MGYYAKVLDEGEFLPFFLNSNASCATYSFVVATLLGTSPIFTGTLHTYSCSCEPHISTIPVSTFCLHHDVVSFAVRLMIIIF